MSALSNRGDNWNISVQGLDDSIVKLCLHACCLRDERLFLRTYRRLAGVGWGVRAGVLFPVAYWDLTWDCKRAEEITSAKSTSRTLPCRLFEDVPRTCQRLMVD